MADATRRPRISPLGPVLFYDLLREGRRSRGPWLRCAYATLLLFVLSWLYWSRFGFNGWDQLFETQSARPFALSSFATDFFSAFFTLQYVVVLVLTPAYAAGAIAEEKEKKTLDYLLATDLRGHEIVLGKLASRVLRLLLLLLTGMPILAMTPFWGGVDPTLVLAGFAATGATMLSVAALSVLNSVYCRRTTDAMLRTYLQIAGFLVFSGCIPGPNLGHPIFVIWMLQAWSDPSAGFWGIGLLASYCAIHLIIALVCLIVAMGSLRRVALSEFGRPAVPVIHVPTMPPIPSPARRLPLVGDDPLLWKEIHLDQRLTWERIPPLLAMAVVFFGVAAASIGMTAMLVPLAANQSPGEPVNWWLRIVGAVAVMMLWLVQGFFGAATISRERERQTLDGLLTLPLGREGVLFAKWLGNVLSTRSAWWVLGVIWGWGLLTGGLHFLSAPLVVLAWAVFTAFTASVALYCSAVSETTLRAVVRMLLALAVVLGGGWLLASAADAISAAFPPPVNEMARLFLGYGVAPPMPLIVLAFPYDSHWTDPNQKLPGTLLAALTGLLFYAGLAYLLWRAALRTFRKRG